MTHRSDDPRGGDPRPDARERVPRRAVLQGLTTGLAGAVAASSGLPASVDASPLSSDRQPPASAPATGGPRLLDDHQRRTLASLAEALIPGSVAAGVVDLIDRVAAVQDPGAQRELLNAIGAFDREARTARNVRWLDLDAETRLDRLRAASTAPSSRAATPPWTPGQPLRLGPDAPSGPPTLRDHFDALRMLVANAYYTTEPGLKERGWTGRSSWDALPGCTHTNPEHE
jgi:hypothetical protein